MSGSTIARVNDVQSRLKNINSFQKERTFFREKDWKSLVGCRYRRVGFDLRETGIVCKVERDGRCETKLGGHSEIAFHAVVDIATCRVIIKSKYSFAEFPNLL